MISVEEAFLLIEATVDTLPIEQRGLLESAGHVLAEDIVSDVDVPPHNKSVMDGFAVRSDDIAEMGCCLRVVETIVAGAVPRRKLSPGHAARIMTGAPLPEGADAVVMIEHTEFDEEQPEQVIIQVDSVVSGKHTMNQAASMAAGDVVLSKQHRIRPTDIGLLAEAGAAEVSVFGRPSVAVLPTGDELVSPSERPGAGQIRNSNGPMLMAMVGAMDLPAVDLGVARDSESDLLEKIARGLQEDVLVLSGGVSAGKLDLVPSILSQLGVQQVFHKIRVKPGKPIWFGVKRHESRRPTFVFGLPGNPVSSLVGFQLFVRTALRKLMGFPQARPRMSSALLGDSHETRGDRPTFWPGCWLEDGTVNRVVRPLRWLGSSDLRALGEADALIYFSAVEGRHEVGKQVEVISMGSD